MKQTLEYIQQHLGEEISLEAIANYLQMSQYYFCHLFKESMGVSPYQYVLQQRIEKAKQLLRQRQLTITTIALEYGFANQTHSRDRFYIDSLVHLFYCYLLQHHTTSNEAEFLLPSHPSKRKLRLAIEYMQANLQQEINLMEFAALLNMGSYELTLLFLDLTGLTPYQYLIRCRIEKSKELLKNPQFSIQEIATKIGFFNLDQFNYKFLQLTGISPQVYRAEYVV